MDKFKIAAGNRLTGTVHISGAKNASLPEICASLLTGEKLTLHNVPDLDDIHTLRVLLESMGIDVVRPSLTSYTFSSGSEVKREAPYELVKTMRASILVLGPLLARFGEAIVSLPGGCAIGARPVDQHIKGLQAMGAQIAIEHGNIVASVNGRLQGTRFHFDVITVTGTENLMMAATLANGETILENCAREPEVVDLANLLIQMGARIDGQGTDTIRIQGMRELHGAEHSVISDRIEAGTFLCAVAVAGGEVTLEGAVPDDLRAIIAKLREAGATIEHNSHWLRISSDGRLRPVNIMTEEHPGFPTDLQPQFMVVNALAMGHSSITERIFENRFMHVSELNRLGAQIDVQGRTAIIKGVPRFSGATVMATDLRAGAALVIAALGADGETTIDRIYHIDRGYDGLEKKLTALGAQISRI